MDSFKDLSVIDGYADYFHKQYQSDDNEVAKEKALKKVQREFVRKYSLDFISKHMTENDYICRICKQDSFCYSLEHTLHDIGSLGQIFPNMFLMTHEKSADYSFFSSLDPLKATKHFKNIKEELSFIIKCAQKGDIQKIEQSKFCYPIKYKIYYIYSGGNDVPVFKREHVQKILSYLGHSINTQTSHSESLERKKLMEIKKNNATFSKMTNIEFMCFLYSNQSGIDLNAKSIISKNRKDEEVEYVTIQPAQLLNIDKQTIYSKVTSEEYKNVAYKKSAIGEEGELLVYRQEKKRLKNNPRLSAYVNKVKKISDDDVHAGYDILSYDLVGDRVVKLKIEVKTKKYGEYKNVDFYISDNEKDTLSETIDGEIHAIFYVCGITQKKKTIYRIDSECLSVLNFKPILYKVEAKVDN